MGRGAAATRPPEQGRRCFDQLPGTVERLLTGATTAPALDEPLLRGRFDRLLLVYLDAFGWTFLERAGAHPLLDRARSEGLLLQLTSQFPSTTSAHVTTIHSGLPVAEHGVYEWYVLEPSLNRLITPLPFSFAGDGERETLAGVLPPETVYPAESLHGRLAESGVRSAVAVPAVIARSSTSRVLLRHAEILPFTEPAQGLAAAAHALAGEARYALVYLAHVDSLMHTVGPGAPAVGAAFAAALTAIAETPVPRGTLVLVTADHGMSPVEPARTVYVNVRWPGLARHLETGADGKPLAPAGSCRDLFLHVREGRVGTVCEELAARLDGVADVVPVERLVADGVLADPSPRLRARLADVVVLPRYGEAVYWYEPGRFVQQLHGQHGGLSPEEMEIPLLACVA